MSHPPRYFLFVPTYNVADRVLAVLEAIPPATLKRFHQILIIDNGSADGTREVLREWLEKRADFRFRLLFNATNYSLGGSTIIALREAISAGGDFLVCLHSDGQADPRALDDFLDRADPSVDFVLGNRLADRSLARNYSLIRWLGNRFFETIQNIVVGQKLGDIGAYIAFNLKTIQSLPYWKLPPDMSYQPLLVLLAARHKRIRLVDFPITWGKADRSNVNLLRYGTTHLLRLLGLYFGHVPSFPRQLTDFHTVEK